MSAKFEIRHPLPSRRSAEALREQIVDHFVSSRPVVGEKFLSEYELARAAGLSRPTVRRAMEELHREGWIERRSGQGTFIGPRAALPLSPRRMSAEPARHVARMAVLVHNMGDFRHDWYSPEVLHGMDDVAHDLGVSIELVGDRDGDVRSVGQRLMQSRPDVLACIAPQVKHAMLMGEANRLHIPVIGTGTLLAELGIPCVHENGVEGAAAAVRYLVEQGHRRIGFIAPTIGLPWVFQRHQGYLSGLREAGLPADNCLTLFFQTVGDVIPQPSDVIADFLHSMKPTAVVLANFWPMHDLARLRASGKVRVPEDLSVVTFDQHPDAATLFGGVEPTTIALPLREMGRRLAQMARDVVDGTKLKLETLVPCEFRPGASVRALNGNGNGAHPGHMSQK